MQCAHQLCDPGRDPDITAALAQHCHAADLRHADRLSQGRTILQQDMRLLRLQVSGLRVQCIDHFLPGPQCNHHSGLARTAHMRDQPFQPLLQLCLIFGAALCAFGFLGAACRRRLREKLRQQDQQHRQQSYCSRKPCSALLSFAFFGKETDGKALCFFHPTSSCISHTDAVPSASCRYAATCCFSASVHSDRMVNPADPACTVCPSCISVISSSIGTPKRCIHSVRRELSSRSCAFCRIDISALWIWTEDGTTSMALFSSGFTPGASRKRTTRIYSPATAFMHLPAQPVPVSKAVTSAQIQAMQNAAAAF